MSYVSEVLADAPSVLLKLDDATTSFADASGNGHVQAVTTPITAGQAGISSEITSSALFTGGRIDEDFGSTTAYTALTVEGWYKSTNGNGTLWTSRGTSGNGFTLFIGVTGAGFGAAGQFSFGLDGALYQGVSTNSKFNDGIWHHVVGVFSRNSGTITPSDFSVYVDGVLQAVTSRAVTGSTAVPVTPSQNWTIGQHPAGWANGTLNNTNLAAMALYPTALSPDRISAHYSAMNLIPSVAVAQTSADVMTQATVVRVSLVQSSVEALSVPLVVPVALIQTYAEIMLPVNHIVQFKGWGVPI